MPRLSALTSTRMGAELLRGNTVVQINDSARTDTHAADGEVAYYRSGVTLVMQIFDFNAQAWRERSLT
mgnify:CR=1 FL=1